MSVRLGGPPAAGVGVLDGGADLELGQALAVLETLGWKSV